ISSVIIANYSEKKQQTILLFEAPQRENPSIFQWGEIFVELPKAMIQDDVFKIEADERIEQIGDRIFKILKSGARLGVFSIDPKKLYPIQIKFVPYKKKILGAHILNLDLVQFAGNQKIGGQRFVLKNP